MQRFGIVEKRVYPEVPPRVEYALTELGGRFAAILDDIDRVQRWLENKGASRRARP